MNLSSDFVGKTNIDYCSEEMKLSEEYIGGFGIDESISEDKYSRSASSNNGSGYVDVYKKVGDDFSTYERGSGTYQAEEVIEANDYARKDVSLVYSPASYAYLPGVVANRSLMWEEGLRLNASNGLYTEESFRSLERLEKEGLITWPNEVRTLSIFTGKASLKSVFRPHNNYPTLAVVADEYVGSYSIERKLSVLPRYTSPHMSVYTQGYVDPNSCNVLRFTVSVVNDGNRTFAPIYVRDTFPSGTRFIGSSIEPIELTRSYGNWSIPALGSGESATIEMQFKVATQRDNYTNRARANTIYVYDSRGVLRERNLRVNNSTILDVDWAGCPPEPLPLDFSATISPDAEDLVSYRLVLNNSAGFNMSANITVLLPEGMSYVNSTTATSQNESNEIKWSIKRLDVNRRRTISFLARAEREGLFIANAQVSGNSIEGSKNISASTIALIRVGKAPITENIESLESLQWLPCDDRDLYQSLAKLDVGSTKEIKCCW